MDHPGRERVVQEDVEIRRLAEPVRLGDVKLVRVKRVRSRYLESQRERVAVFQSVDESVVQSELGVALV